MTPETSRYADFEGLRHQAVALRREGPSLRQIRDRLQVYNNDLLHRLVKGEPPPDWTKRPNAKDDLRARARELRLRGKTYDQIQVERVEPERLAFRVMIHMTADVEGAKQYWADLAGVDPATFQKTTIKKHNPKTVRKNIGPDYRGCLVIRVSQGAELYRRIEG
ncbi:hypothetical protein ACFY8W_33500 [Streptomyces sp. NPDC012637]|uniref:hypothetical protein n=1 Tax=Streptomyces sp. NPDC012637 TaxID=3364842 RepID=UPI0036EDC3DD